MSFNAPTGREFSLAEVTEAARIRAGLAMSDGHSRNSPERRALTLAELQAELGPENTNHLVTRIGALAQAHGVERAGMPMAYTIDRVLQSLTKEERASMAQGSSVPPRVEALISAEAEVAKQQRQSDAARADSREFPIIPLGMLAAFGLGPLAATRNLPGSSERGYTSLNSRWDPSSGGAGLSQANYASTPFAGLGLDYNVTKNLFSQGFNAQQIMKAANDSQALGLSVNEDAARVARLNRDAPRFVPEAKESKKNWGEYYSAERDLHQKEGEAAKLREQGQAAEAAKLEAEIAAQRRRLEEQKRAHEQHDQGAINAVPAERRNDARTVIEHIRENERRRFDRNGPATHEMNQEERRSELHGRGEEKVAEAQHKQTIAQLDKNKKIEASDESEFAALLDKKVADIKPDSNQQAEVKPTEKPGGDVSDKKDSPSKKPETRQALRIALANPKI